ncbi:flagellar motor switch phosphatase FliY [Metabacillus halosaccharovorans]|uniref:flagellar motor switch phosphatase FliY n=1 Tax=Metabacillus halosaccharovorans TaxID=930124 RepID=UPI0020424493|nr:flagellar motor switch phosphatase FliY [Metabacillus halosaccharovorans]MCM3441089.1 flagellar motor switch phosphatase FliY [Metabacillus halosaccharovorans]
MVSNDMLSQDEIDALLKGSSIDEEEHPVETEVRLNNEDYFDAMEEDAIGEIGNISFGSSATALSTLLQQKVEITTPSVSIIHKNKLGEQFQHPYVAIEVNYTEGFSGSNLLVIKQSDAAIIADLMIGGDGTNPDEMLGEIQVSAVQEAMNQMMGSAATSMSTIFNKKVDISPPSVELLDANETDDANTIPNEELFVQVSFRLKIGTLIDSNIMQLLPLHFAKDLIDQLINPKQEAAATAEAIKEVQEPQAVTHAPIPEMTHSYQNDAQQSNSHAQSVYEQHMQQQQPSFDNPMYQQQFGRPMYESVPGQHIQQRPQPSVNVKPAEFASFEQVSYQQQGMQNLDMLLDIPLKVTVELGRTKRSVKEILELSSGSIIELDKLAGEHVDILVNNKIVAKGEVVVIDENFGVRVTDIISQSERLNKLK